MSDKILTVEEIKQKLFPVFERYEVKKAILFGSYAYGEPTEKSDVDIYVDCDEVLKGLRFFGLYESVAEMLNKKTEVIPNFDLKSSTNLFQIIDEKGITIYEKER